MLYFKAKLTALIIYLVLYISLVISLSTESHNINIISQVFINYSLNIQFVLIFYKKICNKNAYQVKISSQKIVTKNFETFLEGNINQTGNLAVIKHVKL